MAAQQQQQQLQAEIGRKLDDVFDSSVILPLAQSMRYRVPVARTTFAVAAEPGRIEDANKQLSDDVAALTTALLSSAHLTEVLAQSHALRELHTQLASSLSSSKKDTNANDTSNTGIAPPDLLVFSLRALVPTLVTLAATPSSTVNADTIKIFDSVADLVAKQVSLCGGNRALPSYGNELNAEVAPLFGLLTTGVVSSAPGVQAAIADILLGIAILRGSPREILSVALVLVKAGVATNVTSRMSSILRALIEPKAEAKKDTPASGSSTDEKVDEKETDEQKQARLRAVEEKRRREEEGRKRREDRDRRRRDPKSWPWHPSFIVESFAPSYSPSSSTATTTSDNVERKAGLPTLTSRVASLLLLQQLERNAYPDEQAESHRYPQRVSLRAGNGLTVSFYTQDKSLRAFYSSSEPTPYQVLDLEWTDDGRKVTISSKAKTGSETVYYPNDSENLGQWSASELKSMTAEARGIQLGTAQWLVVRPDPSQPHKIGLRSAKHGYWFQLGSVEGNTVNGTTSYDKEKCLFTVTSMDPSVPWGGASSSAATFEPMTMELHPDTFASLAGIIDASSTSLVSGSTAVNSDACTLLSALNVLKFHLTRYTATRQMVGELTSAAIERLQQLFFTIVPARVLKITDVAIRTAVENALIVAILAGLDLFFPKSWMQLSFLGRELEKKEKSSLETRLCESLLNRFTEFSSHVRLVTEIMATQQTDVAETKRGIDALDSMVFGLLKQVLAADGRTGTTIPVDSNLGLYQRVLTNFQRALLALSSVTLPSSSSSNEKKDEKDSKSNDIDSPLTSLQLKYVRTVLHAATEVLDATTKSALAIASQPASPVSVTALSSLADGLWRGFLFNSGRPLLISLVAVINSSSPAQLSFILRLLPMVSEFFKSLLESEKAVLAVINKNKPKDGETKETKGETKTTTTAAAAAPPATPTPGEEKKAAFVRATSTVVTSGDEKRSEEAPPPSIEAKAHTHTLRYETVLAKQCNLCNQLITAGGYTCGPCDWSMCMTCFGTAKRNGEVRASAATEAKVTEYKFDKARVREALRERKYPVDDNAAFGRFISRWDELDPQSTGRVNRVEFMARIARDVEDAAEGKMRAEKQWALVCFLLCQTGPEVRPDDKDEVTFWEGLQSISYAPSEALLNEVRDLVQLGRAAPQAGKEKAKAKMAPVSELPEDKDEGLAEGHVDSPEWRWLFGGLSYTVAYLSGRATGILASVAPLRDAASSSSDKSKVQNWLESRLFAGGLDGELKNVSYASLSSQAIPSSVVTQVFTEQKITMPDAKRPAKGGVDMDEDTFLQSLVDMKAWDASTGGDPPTRANNLIAKLDKAVRPAILQQSVKEGANHATRALFAALLKHSSPSESPILLAMADSRQPLATPPTESVKKLWEKASQIKPLIAQKKGQGADIPAYVATVVAKCQLLLTVAVVAPPTSAATASANEGAPALQRAVSVGEVLAVAKSTPGRPSISEATDASRPPIDRTVSAAGPRKSANKRVKRTARILISVIWRVMESCQKLKRRILARNVPTPSQPWRWGKKGTNVNLTASLIAFVRDESVNADDVYASLAAQRSVALMRYAGIRHLSDLIATSPRPKLVAVALSQLSDALRATGLFTPPKATDGSVSGRAPEYLGHFMDQLPALGPIISETLTDSYFGLVTALLRSKTLSNSNPHVQASLLSLANIDLTPADMQQLTEVSMLSFIAPLISFVTEAAADTKLGAKVAEIAASGTAATPAQIDSAAPWNIRFGAFTLFRLLSYLSSSSSAENAAATPNPSAAAAGGDAADAQKLAGLLVDQMWNQINSIITIRSDFAAIAATKTDADEDKKEAKRSADTDEDATVAALLASGGLVGDNLPPISLEGWSCGACTFINGLEANKCAICETPRPQVSVAPATSGGSGGTGTGTTSLAAATTAVSVPGIRQWNEREVRTRLQQSAVGWFHHNLADVGLTGKPYATPSAAISELNLYLNQFMWIILRVVSLDSANNNVSVAAKLASDPDWLGFLLSAACVPLPAGVGRGRVSLSQPATTSRAIAAAVLRRVLPLANLSDDKKSHTSQSAVVHQLLNTIGRTSLPSAGTTASSADIAQRSELIFLIRSLLGGKGEGDKQFQKGGERADAAPATSVDSKEEEKSGEEEKKGDDATSSGSVWPQALSYAPRAWRDACETELKSSFTAIATFKDTPAGLAHADETIIRRAIAAAAVMGAHIEQLREGGRVLVKLATDDVVAGTLSHLELNPTDNNGAGPRIVVRLDTGEVQRPTSLGELKPIDEVIPSLNADGMDGVITTVITASSSFVTVNPPTSPCSPAVTQLHRRLLALFNAIVQLPNFSSRFPSHQTLFPTIGLLATTAIADGVGALKPLSTGHAEARIAFLEQPAPDDKRPTMVGTADAPSLLRSTSLVAAAGSAAAAAAAANSDVIVVPVPEINSELWKQWRDGAPLVTMLPGSLPESDFTTEGNRAGDTRRHHMKRASMGVTKARADVSVRAGCWYYEVHIGNDHNNATGVGWVTAAHDYKTESLIGGQDAHSWVYMAETRDKMFDGKKANYGIPSEDEPHTVGCLLNFGGNGTIPEMRFFANGRDQGIAYLEFGAVLYPYVATASARGGRVVFSPDEFKQYTAVQKLYPELVIRPLEKVPLTTSGGGVELPPYAERAFLLPCRQGVPKDASSRVVDTMADTIGTFTNGTDGVQSLSFPSAEMKADGKAKPNDKGITVAFKLARPTVSRTSDIITIGKWNGTTAAPGSSAAVRVSLNSGTGAVTITAASPDARAVTNASATVASLAEKKQDSKSEEKKELTELHLKGQVRARDNDVAELTRRVAYGRVVHVITAANAKPDTFTTALSIDVENKSIVISNAAKADVKWSKTSVKVSKPLAELHAVHLNRGNEVGFEREWGNDKGDDEEPNHTRFISLVFGENESTWHLEFASPSDVALFTTYFQLFSPASFKGRAISVEFQPRLKSRAHPQTLAWCDPRSALCDICYNNIEAAWNTVEGYDLCIPCFDKTLIREKDNTAVDVDVALTIDTAAKEVRLYVGGDQVASLPYVHTATALPADLSIVTSSIIGKLSQVATWNDVLKAEQIRGVHVNGLAALVERDTGTVSGAFPIPLTDNGLFGMATAGRLVRLLDTSLSVTGTGIISLSYTNTGEYLQVLDEQKGHVIESCSLKSLTGAGRAPAVVGDAAPSGGTVSASFLTLLGVNVTTFGSVATPATSAPVQRGNVASFTFSNEEKGSIANTFFVEFESSVERDVWLELFGMIRTKVERKHALPKVDPYAYLDEYGIKADWIVPARKQLFPDTPKHWPLRRSQRRTLIAWSRDNAAHLAEASLGPKLLAAARALSQMGFELSRALDAVAVTGGDTAAATAWLLQGTESPPAGDLRNRLQKLLDEEPAEIKRTPSIALADAVPDAPPRTDEKKSDSDGKEEKGTTCQWCDEKEPAIFCGVCNKKLCGACDGILHKSLRRREHVRAAIGAPVPAEKKMVLPATSAFASASSGSNPRWAVPYRPTAVVGGNLCGAGVEKDVAPQLAPYFAPATFEDLARADKAKAAIALDQALTTVYARSVVLAVLRQLSIKYTEAAERVYDNRDVTPAAGAAPVTLTPPIDALNTLGSLVSKGSFSGGAFLSRLMAELQLADVTNDIAELQSSLRRLVTGDAYALVSLPTATAPFASILVTEAAMQLGFFAEKTAKSDSGAEAHMKLASSLLNLFLDIALPLLSTCSAAAGERLMNAFFPKFVTNLILNQTVNAVSLDASLPLVHITGKLLTWSGVIVDAPLIAKLTGILYKGFSVFPAPDPNANPPVVYSAAFQAFVDLNLTLVKRTMSVEDNLQRITKFEVRPPGSKPKKPKSIYTASAKYGTSRDGEWDDTKDPACGPRRVLRAIHLRAGSSIDGIQLVYGDEGDPAATHQCPYHGGSGSDRWFYLEPGEYINQVSGAYSEYMVKLKFTTTKGRSQEFGQGSGNNFVAKAPEGKVLHHCSGFSDGYLNAIRFYWGPTPTETFAQGLVSNTYGPDTGNSFDDSRVASGKVLRALFVRSGGSIDGIRAVYGDASDPIERYEADYHGGGGNDHWFRLEPGEHIVRITGTSGGDHMNRLRFFTNRGRASEQFGNDSGVDWSITAPDGHILYYFAGKSDGYLCQLRAYFRIPVAETFPPAGSISQMYGSGSGNAFDDGKAQTQGKVLRTIHLRASGAVDGIQCLYGEPSDPEDSIEMPYHGGSGTDRWFRLEPGEHVKGIEGAYGSDHIEKLVFITTRGRRSEDFGSGSNNEFKVSAPEGKILHHVSGKSDGYLNTIRFHFGDIPVESFVAGAAVAPNPMYGPSNGNSFDDGKLTKGKVLRTIHLRASAAIDGIQCLYGEPSDMDESLEMPYHGGSGTDQYFRLEAGEHIKEITGTYGSDHMERLRFKTTRGRESSQFGSGSGTDFKAVAPEGKILHHFSGKSDGYLCALKCFWSDIPDEKFVANPNVSASFGSSQGRPFDDGKEAKDKILRQIHLRASSAIDGIQMIYVDPADPSETLELDYHGGSGTDQWFRMEPGEHITKVDGVYDTDHMEQLKFHTNRGRTSQQFGSNGGTSFSAVAPDGMVLRHISGKSDGYLNAIKFYWGLPLEEKKAAAGEAPTSATSDLFGPERGDQVWSDTKESTGRIIRTVHLRASAAIDGIQMLYGEPGDPSESVEARYHGGSGTDQYFRLEAGEAIIRVTGTYGSEHMERLQFFTNRGRSSPQFGTNSGTDFEAKAPTGMVLHKISGRSDGYLNAIRFHWRVPIIETLPPPGTITPMYGPLKQNAFNDRAIASVTVAGVTTHRHIRRIHCKASNSIDGIQFFYSDPGQRDESYETPYHGGSGNDQDFRLEVGEHIVQINLTYSSDHMEKLRFTTNKGRNSQVFGSRGGNDITVKAPAGMCLAYCAGRNDGYLNALGFYFRPEPDCKDWGVEKTEEELKLLWTCGTCTLYNPLTAPTCSACGTAQPEKLAPGAKEEKDIPLDWFESLIDFTMTAAWLVKPVGAPPLQLFKKVKAKYDDLEYEYDLNPDELVKLVERVSPTQDFNLMRFANKARDNKEAVEEVVDNLFTSPTAALSFGALTKDQVKMRYYVLSYFNDRVRAVLPFVDLSRPDSQSILAAAIRSVRHLLFNSEKGEEWRMALERSKDNQNGSDYANIDCNMFRANKLWELKRTDFSFRHSYLSQFYRFFAAKPEDDRAKAFRVTNGDRAWKVKMIGLNSIDAGGPYRDAMEHMCQELHAPVLPLFVPCSNARSNNGEGRDRVVPRPLPTRAGERALRLSVYEFIGRLMGLAMRSGNLLALNFPSMVWKHLASQPITHDDVRAIDLLSFQIIDDMREMAATPGISDSVFDSAMADVKFEVYDAAQNSRELIAGGKNISVTWENRQKFCEALLRYRLTEFEVQCEAMRRGLATVVPIQLLSLYTWQELEAKIAGSTVDVDLLEQATEYKSVNAADPHVKLFWQMMRERFTDEQRSRFISFVWGRSRLPTSLAGFGSERFKITPHGREDLARDVNKLLPITHTCFFSIELPRYTNLDAMTDRMTYAMMTSTEIDGDGAQSHGVVQTDIGDASAGEGSLF